MKKSVQIKVQISWSGSSALQKDILRVVSRYTSREYPVSHFCGGSYTYARIRARWVLIQPLEKVCKGLVLETGLNCVTIRGKRATISIH